MLGRKIYRGYNHMMLSTSLLLTCCREGSAVPQDVCRHLPRIHTCTSNPAQPLPVTHTIQDISSSYVNIHENSRIY